MFNLKNFVIPRSFTGPSAGPENSSVGVIVPTYKPGSLTFKLIKDILVWNPGIHVFVIDDCTPLEYESSFKVLRQIADLGKHVRVLRTPSNKMKAGAINYGLSQILALGTHPGFILTLDDDVVIEKNTIKFLAAVLMADKRLGAVCSQCRALNKNKNLLTRLQGLEYLGFNATRLADEGFFHGPLVMHGMLTAFRTKAILDVGGFTEFHLIEDYEITARIKSKGWHVTMAPASYAWTEVPETFSQLWRQRTRWVYGGITVITGAKNWSAVLQDVIGHFMFLLNFAIIIISFFIWKQGHISSYIVAVIIIVSLLQALISYAFQLWYMRFYRERDMWDWIIRVSLVPEFVYSNILTFVLLGAYFFHLFNWMTSKIPLSWLKIQRAAKYVRNGFGYIGYVKGWGTRG